MWIRGVRFVHVKRQSGVRGVGECSVTCTFDMAETFAMSGTIVMNAGKSTWVGERR